MARRACAASWWATPVSPTRLDGGQSGFLDRRVRILLEVAQEPTRGDAGVTAGILAG